MKNVLKQTISALIIFFGIFTYEELSDKQNIDEETIELINDEESVEQITQSQNSLAREYIEKNFEVLIRRQEEKLGIVYSARPKISFDCEDGSIYPYNKGAIYIPEREEICIYLEKNNLIKITGREDYIVKIIAETKNMDTIDVNEIIWHELGHFYTHQLCKKFGVENFFWEETLMTIEDPPKNLGRQILAEGIGRYFQNKTAGIEETTFKQEDWSNNAFATSSKYYAIYEGGYSLVKDIMDEYGVRKSLEYFIQNPLVLKNPRRDVPLYKLKAFQELRERNKSKP